MDDGMSDAKVLATFFLMTYNQEKYIKEAIEGAFSQTYSALEIVVSDDCSTDGTFRIIQEMCEKYDGMHKIVVNRNQKNLGLIGHINKITSLSSGELIVCAAGDDISLPHRVERVVERYLASARKASLIHSSVYLIDIEGKKVGTRLPPVISQGMDIKDIAVSGALIIGATSAFTRKIEETFGPIKYSNCIEDLVLGFRSALTGSLEYIPEPLILYRHEAGVSARGNVRNQTYEHLLRREIRNQEIFLAVLAQRIEDLLRVKHFDLISLVKRKRSEVLLRRKLWTRKYRLLKLLSYAIQRGFYRVFIDTFIHEKKRRMLFPLKKILYKDVINS